MKQGHGSDKHRYQQKIIADFSSNVWYKGYPKTLPQLLFEKMKDLKHYPEPEAESLRKKLAKLHQLSEEQIIVGNGSAELFYLLAQAHQGMHSGIVVPAFAEYEDACRINKHRLTFLTHKELFSSFHLELLWLGNPNNPDGKVLSPEQIISLCQKNPMTLFVVDEAYAQLCYGFQSVIPVINQVDNLVVMHSLTKTFAMPGIRLGYAVGAKSVIEKLNAIRIPWSVNSLAIEAGCYVIDHYHELLPDLNLLHSESQYFLSQLNKIEYLDVLPSHCNYFLAQIKHKTAAELKTHLVKKHGLLIRDASNFRTLTPQHFRVALQTWEKNELLIQALQSYYK